MPFRIGSLVINVAYEDGENRGMITVILCNSMYTHKACPNDCPPYKTRAELLVPDEHGLTKAQLKELKEQLAQALQDVNLDDLV